MKKSIFLVIALFFSGLSLCFSQQKTVTLDYYYNNEYSKKPDGSTGRFHYIWEDTTLNGYSIWGSIFSAKGIQLNSLTEAPTPKNLAGTSIYIITDPDTEKETAHPNYMQAAQVKIIADWVKAGGVLVLMANDSSNAELPQFNTLANTFGIKFTNKVRNAVIKDISVGKIIVPEHHEIFKTARTLYMKGICTIEVKDAAKALLEDKGDIIMATTSYGKGTVFAIGDPWIYNEYIVNNRLSSEFQNMQAAKELTDWLIKKTAAKK